MAVNLGNKSSYSFEKAAEKSWSMKTNIVYCLISGKIYISVFKDQAKVSVSV